MMVVTTENYYFHYKKDSTAERELNQIIDLQERCFTEIATTLKVDPDFKINYYLYEYLDDLKEKPGISSQEESKLLPPNIIHAVYNKEIKCVGYREESHLLSYLINRPNSCILSEGLASWFDNRWKEKGNEYLLKDILIERKYIRLEDLFKNYVFQKEDKDITHAIAGAFIGYLIEEEGINKFIELYKKHSNYIEELEYLYGMSLYELEIDFLRKL